MAWEVIETGTVLEVVIGERTRQGQVIPVTKTAIFRQGALIEEELVPEFVARYDDGEEHARSLVRRVDVIEVDGIKSTVPAGEAEKAEAETKVVEVKVNDWDALSPQALEAESKARGLEVEGTGANGNVLKKDLVKALTEADAKQ